MHSLIAFAAAYLVNSLWQVPLIAAAAWLACRALSRLGPQTQHLLWVLALGLAVATPALPPDFFPWPHAASGKVSIAIVAAIQGTATGTQNAALPWKLVMALSCFFAASIAIFAIRLLASAFATAMLERRSLPALLSDEQKAAWQQCQKSFALKDAAIRDSVYVQGPVVAGFRKPILFLPAGFAETCALEDFLAALSHECAHMRRDDFRKNLLYETASLAIAFHPAAWMIKAQIAQTREMICDAMALEQIERLNGTHNYMQSLVRLAGMMMPRPHGPTIHAIGIFDANVLEKRIMEMKRERPKFGKRMRYGLLLPAALVLCFVAAGAAATAVHVYAQGESSGAGDTAKLDEHVYTVGHGVTTPTFISGPDPVFPESARKDKTHFQGKCVVKVTIDKNGNPVGVKIARSLRPDFDEEAIKAVKQYKFEPATFQGKPVAVAVNVEVNFKRY